MPRWAETRIWNEDDDLDPLDPILARFPGPVVITSSKQRRVAVWTGVTLFLALFVGITLRSVDWTGPWTPTQPWSLALAALFCMTVELVAAAGIFFDLGSLTLDARGFEVRSLGTSLYGPWKDVDGFEAEWFRRMGLVSYLYTRPEGEAMRAFQWVFGNREWLSYTYGFGRNDLARLLTLWRERALASSR